MTRTSDIHWRVRCVLFYGVFFLLPSLQTPITHRKAEDDLPTLPKPGASIKRWCFTGRWQPEQHTKKKIKPLARKSCLHCIFLWKLVNGSLARKGNAHKKKNSSRARLVPQSNLTPRKTSVATKAKFNELCINYVIKNRLYCYLKHFGLEDV